MIEDTSGPVLGYSSVSIIGCKKITVMIFYYSFNNSHEQYFPLMGEVVMFVGKVVEVAEEMVEVVGELVGVAG